MTSNLRVRGPQRHSQTNASSPSSAASDWLTPRLCEERCGVVLVSGHHRAERANGASQAGDVRERPTHLLHIKVRWPGTQEPSCACTPPSTQPCSCACPHPQCHTLLKRRAATVGGD